METLFAAFSVGSNKSRGNGKYFLITSCGCTKKSGSTSRGHLRSQFFCQIWLSAIFVKEISKNKAAQFIELDGLVLICPKSIIFV
jgi:hypothetical protein